MLMNFIVTNVMRGKLIKIKGDEKNKILTFEMVDGSIAIANIPDIENVKNQTWKYVVDCGLDWSFNDIDIFNGKVLGSSDIKFIPKDKL